MESVSQTLQDCTQTRKSVGQTIDKIDKFKTDMGDALQNLVSKIARSLPTPSEFAFLRYKPEELVPSNSTIKQLASLIQQKKRIVFLTGAGLSVASGLPTFRGSGGLWTQKNQTFDAKDIATSVFFNEKNDLYWNWNNDFVSRVRKCKMNRSHQAIARLQYCLENEKLEQDRKVLIVTQNIDGYHNAAYNTLQKKLATFAEKKKEGEVYGFCKKIHEIHGNINYLRCSSCEEPQLIDYPENLSA